MRCVAKRAKQWILVEMVVDAICSGLWGARNKGLSESLRSQGAGSLLSSTGYGDGKVMGHLYSRGTALIAWRQRRTKVSLIRFS